MKHLRAIADGLDIAPVLSDLDNAPLLWNAHKLRTDYYGGEHSQVSDIWVRYRRFEDLAELQQIDPAHAAQRFVSEPHDSVWYPGSDQLPNLKVLIFEVMRYYLVERLGGVLITRIPPGGEVKPHVDGGWHAGYYEKVAVQLKGGPDQAFCFEDGEFTCPAGTLYTFDNSKKHWVYNRSNEERMTLFICVKRDARQPPLVYAGG